MKLKRILVGALAFLFISIPFGYLAAETVSLQKEIKLLRSQYPKYTEEEIAVTEAVKKVKNSVVSIVVRQEVFAPSERVMDIGNGFQIVVPGDLKSQGKQVVGQGSGFVIRDDGLIVTNKHVVAEQNADYQVIFGSGKKFDAKVVATDPVNDLALLKISGKKYGKFPAAILGDSKELQMGQTVIAIGNALGELNNSVTKGVVSALNRAILASDSAGGQTERLVKIIQTDAAINPGNSGGPLVNSFGEVVGVNTAVNLGAENIGFAIPVDDVKFVLESFESSGAVVRPFLGVRYAGINEEVKTQKSLPYARGVILVSGENGEPAVTPGGPAEKAGLKEGDIILEINGKRITEENDLAPLVRDFKVGDMVKLRVWKADLKKEVNLSVKLAELK